MSNALSATKQLYYFFNMNFQGFIAVRNKNWHYFIDGIDKFLRYLNILNHLINVP